MLSVNVPTEPEVDERDTQELSEEEEDARDLELALRRLKEEADEPRKTLEDMRRHLGR